MSISSEQKHYPRPPITEAVIELRSDRALSPRDLERCRDKFKRQYEKVEDLNEIEVVFQENKISHRAVSSGYKMTAGNAVDLVMLNPLSLATIRLAPYQRWEGLLRSAKENLEALTKIVGRQNFVRIGARFINRIDIPNERLAREKTTDFIVSGIDIPVETSGILNAYYFNAQSERKDGIKLMIQSGVANPVLLDHTSILLDIDAFIDADIPTRIDEMWERTELLRRAKNSVFESHITDKCRELFQ
jgi:uncharacterized protein (TIGR04255 family)